MSTEREQAVVVITGGAGRIGTAIARAFVRDGARVALCDVHEETLARAATHLRETSAVASSDLATIVADVADERAVEAAFAKAETTLGAITTLVTCAAVYPNTPLVESSVDEWDRVFAVNVRGVMLACRTAARGWIARGTRGAIVNLSSGAARSARRGASAYCGSKAALEMITQTFAVELGAHGIRVNAVAPGLVMDEVISALDPEQSVLRRDARGYAARTHRRGRRHRGGRALPRLGAFGVDDGRGPRRDRRLALRSNAPGIYAAPAVVVGDEDLSAPDTSRDFAPLTGNVKIR